VREVRVGEGFRVVSRLRGVKGGSVRWGGWGNGDRFGLYM